MLIKNNLENHIRYYYYKKNHRKGKNIYIYIYIYIYIASLMDTEGLWIPNNEIQTSMCLNYIYF
jgi:hypothetical protein